MLEFAKAGGGAAETQTEWRVAFETAKAGPARVSWHHCVESLEIDRKRVIATSVGDEKGAATREVKPYGMWGTCSGVLTNELRTVSESSGLGWSKHFSGASSGLVSG